MRLCACALVAAACGGASSGPLPLVPIGELPALEDTNPDPKIVEVSLTASAAEVELEPGYLTRVLAYDGMTPGPLLHARVGDRIIVHFQNDLAEETTIHWHGMRISSEMDGSPMIQSPIPAGGSFTYDFVAPDAGTYWYHPHVNTIEQVDRGLYGAIVVEEEEAPRFTRERVFVLDDARLDDAYQIAPFSHTSGHDVMHGRLGNTLLVNGSTQPAAGQAPWGSIERWRLVNAATARTLTVAVEGAGWRVIGVDGGLLPEPYRAGEVVIAAGQRFDLEVTHDVDLPEARLVALFSDGALPLAAVAHEGEEPAEVPVYPTVTLPQPPSEMMEKEIHLSLAETGFTIDGHVGHDHPIEQYAQGVPVRFTIVNDIGPFHPFHLHGQFFQILERNGAPAGEPGLKDTVLLDALESVTIVTWFENPGRWMYHCHIPEHAENGMMAELEVVPSGD